MYATARSTSQRMTSSRQRLEHNYMDNHNHSVPGGASAPGGGGSSTGGGGGGASNRRRKMAFMKYGSESSHRTSSSRHRSRVHAKQIATTLGDDFPSPMSAMSFSLEGGGGGSFADFGSAFSAGNDDTDHVGGGSNNHSNKDPFPDDSLIQVWDEDPFDEDSVSNKNRRYNNKNTSNDLSSEASSSFQPKSMSSSAYSKTMSTFPSNSSMQSSFANSHQHQQQSQQQQPVSAAQHHMLNTPDRERAQQQQQQLKHTTTTTTFPVAPSSSPVPSHTSSTHTSSTVGSGGTGGGGAAARRRMRIQTRSSSGGGTGNGTGVLLAPTMIHRSDSDSLSQTPPHSPQSMKRYHSADSLGKKESSHHHQHHHNKQLQLQHPKSTDRVSNYTVVSSASLRLHNNKQQSSSNRSVGSTRSVTSSSSTNTETNNLNLFDNNRHPSAGFTFDAFGLDASLINKEVSEAMHDIAGNNPDLSFFLDQDPTDDFAAGRMWDSCTPPGSRSATPVTTTTVSGGTGTGAAPMLMAPTASASVGGEEEDGFVDGFRVTTKTSMMPVHLKHPQSPTNTEKSSLTSSETGSSDIQHAGGGTSSGGGGQVNLFKQKAGFHTTSKPRKVVRPLEHQIQPSSGFVKRDLRGEQPLVQRRGVVQKQQQQQPESEADSDLFEPDFSDFSVSSSNNGRDGDRQEVPSDVGVTSNYIPRNSFAKPVDIVAELRAKKEERSMASSADIADLDNLSSCFQSSSAQDEKKEEDVVQQLKKSSSSNTKQKPSVGSLKSQWEMRETARKAEASAAAPSPDQKSQVVSATASSSMSTATVGVRPGARFEREKGDGRPATTAIIESSSSDEIQQQTSFASLRGNLRPVNTNRDEAASGAKSEVGSPFRGSHVSSILGGLQKNSNQSCRDSQSDVGASTPTFASMNLRKTMGSFSPNNSMKVASTFDSSRATEEAPRLRNEKEQQYQDELFEAPSEELPAKLTYRERRELELKKEREDEERVLSSQQGDERDVASLIKRRIAANKRNTTTETSDNLYMGSVQDGDDNAARGYLHTRQDSKPFDESPRGMVQRKQIEEPIGYDDPHSRVSREAEKQSEPFRTANKTNGPVTDVAASSLPKHDAAVSHLLMLQQIQKQQRPDEQEMVPLGGRSLSGRSETPEPYSPEEKCVKASTPKATMMMLNAFLAGRDTLSSKEVTSGRSTQGNQDHTQDHEEQPNSIDDRSNDPEHSAYRLPARKDDPKYERYYRMLKLGMPLDVVKHAATKDGIDPSVLDGDPNKPVGIPLRHDPEYAKYFKMLSIGLPMEAVKHAMARDGLDSSVMDQDHDLPLLSGKKEGFEEEEPKEKDSHRRARLHWKPLRSVTSNSMWAKIDQDEELGKIKFNEKEFQELFQVDKATESSQKTSSSTEVKRGAVRVIDPKRANNGGIILARLKMSHDEMADAVDGINERALSAEQIENIIEYLPTKEERKALEAYMLEGGQDAAEKFDGLCECEKFMVSMMTVKHAKRKVRALLFKLQFQSCLEDIQRDTVAIETACDELCNSVRMRKLLGIVLTFGNRLNTAGNGKRRAGAFTLDSLLKLNQAKAFDKKTTFLHYIVLIVQRNNELLLRFNDDLPTVFKADKIYWDQCINDLEEVENQLENVRKIALYQARQATVYRLRRKKRDDDEESLSDGEVSLTLEEEVEALRATPIGMFTLSAIKYVSSLRDKVEETKVKFAHLLEYFGEESNMQPHELFSTVVTFSRDFDKAKEQVFANEKRKQREERKRQAVASNGMGHRGRPPTYSPAHPDRKMNEQSLKASNLQPSMSLVLKEMKTRMSTVESEPALPIAKQTIPKPAGSSDPPPRSEVVPPPERRHSPPKVESLVDYAATLSRPTENRPQERRSYPSTPDDRESANSVSATNTLARSEKPSTSEQRPLPAATPRTLDGPDDSSEDAGLITPTKSTPSAPSSGSAVRAKARLRRHRYVIERQTSSPASMMSSPEQASKPLVTNSAPLSAPTDRATVTVSPTFQRMNAGSLGGTTEEAASPLSAVPKPLSPRSSMRNRMERHKLRQPKPSATTSSFPSDSVW